MCAALGAVNTESVYRYLNADLESRMRAIPRSDLSGDVTCGETTYFRGAAQGLSYASVGFSTDGRYAAVQTHFQSGQYLAAGDRCLLERRGRAWRKLGCSPQYIS